MSVLVACERQRSVMGQQQVISDQSRLLSYLSILAMVTFLSKFYVREKKIWITFGSWIFLKSSSSDWTLSCDCAY